MAKMYLFRKLSELNQKQSDVCEEAVSSVLDDVLKGKTSTIFNYGKSPGHSGRTAEMGRERRMDDMIERILSDLFSQVYSMEATLQIKISVKHMQLNVMQKQLFGQTEDDDQCRNEHFVATPHEVYVYIEKVLGELQQQGESTDRPANGYPYMLFSICVSQANSDQSLQLHGCLQIVQVQPLDRSEIMPDTAMASLLKIINALASNPKTHLRYYNIRLTRILKDLLGNEGTIIMNYSTETDTQRNNKLVTIGCSKIWKALYIREHVKYNCLTDKLLRLESCTSRGLARQLHKLLDSLRTNKISRNIYSQHTQKFHSILETQLCDELKRIKSNAMANFDEMLQIQQFVTQLAINDGQQGEKQQHKERMLSRLHLLLAQNNNRLYKQCITYRRKLATYLEMFRNLWTQQRLALQLREQEREEQLSKQFDANYDELQSTHHLDSLKLRRNCSQPAR